MFILVNHCQDTGLMELGRYDTREEAAKDIALTVLALPLSTMIARLISGSMDMIAAAIIGISRTIGLSLRFSLF